MANSNPHQLTPEELSKGGENSKRGISLTTELIKQFNEGDITIEQFMKVTIENALKGNHILIKEIWDRIDGKTKDKIELSGTISNHITIRSDKDNAN